ncbi:hypothetical protein AB4K20DRAFT_1971602 [Rhizopus microsporus]
MPLVIFGDGLRNKDHIKFKGLRHGVSNKIYRQLKHREGLGDLLLFDINEYKISKTCNSCLNQELQNLKCRPNVFKRQLATSNVVASSHSGRVLALRFYR